MSLLIPYLRKYLHFYIMGIVCIFLTNLLAVNIPVYIQRAVDLLIDEEATGSSISALVMIIFTLSILMIIVRTFSRILFFNPGRAIEMNVKNDMFEKLMSLPKDYYDKNPSGASISKINNDINGVRMLCGFAAMQFFNLCFAFSLTPYKMWQLSPKLTLLCLIPIGIIFIIIRSGMYFLIKYMRIRRNELQHFSDKTISFLSGLNVIKPFAMKDWAMEGFDQLNVYLKDLNIKLSVFRTMINPFIQNMENILKVFLIWIGTSMVIDGSLTAGQITAFMAYTAMMTIPLSGLGWLTTIYQQGKVGVESVNTILGQEDPEEDITPTQTPVDNDFAQHGIVIKNLSFSYDHQTDVLSDIHFNIKPGQVVGLLGSIGSGKTTLVNCINGYLNDYRGQILIGGKDIRNLKSEQLHSLVKTVSQEPFLFSESIEDNINFGSEKGKLDPDQLKQVLHQCAMGEEIRRFPDREKTMVGEKGIMLSGGQKQRISLARAMVAPCKLLMLDNVLSAVDYDTEKFLLKQIYDNKGNRSLFIISHRISILTNADLILVMEKGKIIDSGTHQELLISNKYYKKTWTLQQEIEAASHE